MIWPDLGPTVGVALYALAAVVLAVGVCDFFGWLRVPFLRISLTTAARRYYDQSDDRHRTFIVGLNIDPTDYARHAILEAANQGAFQLYGRRQTGLRHEPIPRDEIPALDTREENDLAYRSADGPRWVDVRVPWNAPAKAHKRR